MDHPPPATTPPPSPANEIRVLQAQLANEYATLAARFSRLIERRVSRTLHTLETVDITTLEKDNGGERPLVSKLCKLLALETNRIRDSAHNESFIVWQDFYKKRQELLEEMLTENVGKQNKIESERRLSTNSPSKTTLNDRISSNLDTVAYLRVQDKMPRLNDQEILIDLAAIKCPKKKMTLSEMAVNDDDLEEEFRLENLKHQLQNLPEMPPPPPSLALGPTAFRSRINSSVSQSPAPAAQYGNLPQSHSLPPFANKPVQSSVGQNTRIANNRNPSQTQGMPPQSSLSMHLPPTPQRQVPAQRMPQLPPQQIQNPGIQRAMQPQPPQTLRQQQQPHQPPPLVHQPNQSNNPQQRPQQPQIPPPPQMRPPQQPQAQQFGHSRTNSGQMLEPLGHKIPIQQHSRIQVKPQQISIPQQQMSVHGQPTSQIQTQPPPQLQMQGVGMPPMPPMQMYPPPGQQQVPLPGLQPPQHQRQHSQSQPVQHIPPPPQQQAQQQPGPQMFMPPNMMAMPPMPGQMPPMPPPMQVSSAGNPNMPGMQPVPPGMPNNLPNGMQMNGVAMPMFMPYDWYMWQQQQNANQGQ